MALTPRQQTWQSELDRVGQKVFEADLLWEWMNVLLLPIGFIAFTLKVIDNGLTGMFVVVLIFGVIMSIAYGAAAYTRIRAYSGTKFVVDFEGVTTWDGVFVSYTDIAEVRPRSTWKHGGLLQIALTESAARRHARNAGRVKKSPIGLNFGPSIWVHDYFQEGLLTRRLLNRPNNTLGEWLLHVSNQADA